MSVQKKVIITKASGEREVFDESRLRRSLELSGANDVVISQIIRKIENNLYDGISTREIYQKAFSLLRKSSRSTAARYKLKKAIYELGPTGFPFEKFIAAILRYQGFETITNVILKGHCISHEIDIVAEKGKKHFIVECKFHGDQGRFCDVKVPLYIHSRFQDITREWRKHPDNRRSKIHQGWIFTNTRFTTDAIKYGRCSGLMLVSWDYPKRGSLKERIDLSGLHPITCLTTLSRKEKKALLEEGRVLCRELCEDPKALSAVGVDSKKQKKVLEEVRELCCL